MASGILEPVRIMLMILAEFGHSKTGQSTDGHQLNGHKRLAETNDDQVIYGNSK